MVIKDTLDVLDSAPRLATSLEGVGGWNPHCLGLGTIVYPDTAVFGVLGLCVGGTTRSVPRR